MRYLIASMTLLLLLSFSCKKHENPSSGPSSISGIIVDNGNGKPIAGAQIFVYSKQREQVGALAQRLVKFITSDKEGHFSASFYYFSDSLYSYDAKAKDYLDQEQNSLNAGNNSLEIRMRPWGYIRFNVVNVPPKDTLKYLYVTSVGISLYSMHKDTILFAQAQGNVVENFAWYVALKNGDVTRYPSSIFIKPHDTVDFRIEY